MEPLTPPPDLDELLAAHALDALDDTGRAQAERVGAADPAAAARLARYRAVGAALSEPRPGALAPAPAAVLRRALAARSPGRSLTRPAVDPSVAAIHADRAASLADLVVGLGARDWAAPTRLGRPVQAVLAHLLGQLERTATELGDGTFAEPAEGHYEHWTATALYVERFGTGDPGRLVDALADVQARLAAALPRAPGATSDLASPAARALTKAYELWMHADDVRLALGRPVEVPDGGALGVLCTLAADAVPYALAAAATPAAAGASARLVLTGVGGGVWRRALTPGEPVPDGGRPDDVTIIAEAHGFCRLFHAQVAPAELGAHVEGDAALGARVLAAASALAERT